MRIAILGATSQIARDLILSFEKNDMHELVLFTRNTEVLNEWIYGAELGKRYLIASYDYFSNDLHFDAIVNFVGVGDPKIAADMGSSIFDITLDYDCIVLNYLKSHQECRYLFLSSGAVYGSEFNIPANAETNFSIPVNNILPHDWYGISKMHAEARHRSMQDLSIIDIRVFNYFSHTQNMASSFLIADIVRAISSNKVLQTSSSNIVRDFLIPLDFYQMVKKLLQAPKVNCAVDCYTLSPICKLDLLTYLKERFNLQYQLVDEEVGPNATGRRLAYYSLNRRASQFGYKPKYDSIGGVCKELNLYIKNNPLK